MHISNVPTSNDLFSISGNKGFHSNNSSQINSRSTTDTASISNEAIAMFQEFKYGTQKAENGKTPSTNSAQQNLNEAVREQLTTGKWVGDEWHFAEEWPAGASTEDMESWPPENRALYQQLEKELQAVLGRMPDHPPDRSPEILKEVETATNKLMVLSTFGKSHSMTEAMVEEAANVFIETLDDHHFAKTGIRGDGKALVSLALSKGQTPEELEEKLKKLKDDLINQISSPDARVATAQQDGSENTLSATSSNLDNAKISAQQSAQAHNDMDTLEMQRMNSGLKHYEKTSASI